MNWQPIETAPRNGTYVDLWVSGEFEGRRADCYWGVPTHSCGEHGNSCDSEWHFADNDWIDATFNAPLNEVPTHWMPLPPAPGEQG